MSTTNESWNSKKQQIYLKKRVNLCNFLILDQITLLNFKTSLNFFLNIRGFVGSSDESVMHNWNMFWKQILCFLLFYAKNAAIV